MNSSSAPASLPTECRKRRSLVHRLAGVREALRVAVRADGVCLEVLVAAVDALEHTLSQLGHSRAEELTEAMRRTCHRLVYARRSEIEPLVKSIARQCDGLEHPGRR
ncbi:MAG: hypothetical protein MJD61_18970 [Proteobacteria bacterium]|nr:hypothetical protein [Pseudomonadota bacterium]